jgi:hypothetical protein
MNDKTNEEILATLKEMLKWVKFSGVKEVRTVLMSVLDTEQKRMIYHLSDGKRGTIEIGNLANVSNSTVGRYWEALARLGIMEPIAVQGGTRYKKSFELGDFGFNVPQTKTDNTNSKTDMIENVPEERGETQ